MMFFKDISGVEDKEIFTRCKYQNQNEEPSCCYKFYRWLMAIFHLSIFIYLAATGPFQKFKIANCPLAFWPVMFPYGAVGLTAIHYIVAALSTMLKYDLLYSIYWDSHHAVVDISGLNMLMYWIFFHKALQADISAPIVFGFILNFIVLFVDLFIVAHSVEWKRVWCPVLGIILILVIVAIVKFGISTKDVSKFCHPEEKTTLLTLESMGSGGSFAIYGFFAVLFVIIFHTITWGVCKIKDVFF